MSIQALTWVIYGVASDIKHADFRTLLVLADHADPQGMGAYPSRSTISRLTGYSVRTVSYALKSLESSGLISRGDQRVQPRRIQADRLEPQHEQRCKNCTSQKRRNTSATRLHTSSANRLHTSSANRLHTSSANRGAKNTDRCANRGAT